MPPRILVTRAPHQASALAVALRARGLEPILIPTIELAAPTSFVVLDAAIANLKDFRWLLFTSANAVEAFANRLPQPNPLAAHSCLIGAIGPATARAVISLLGVEPTLVPPQAVAESFAAALISRVRQTDATATRFLLIRAEEARDTLPEALRGAGAEVTIAPAYRNVVPDGSIAALRTLLTGEDACLDAITFTSGSTAINLKALLDKAQITLPGEVLLVSIGPITSQAMRDLGMPPHAEAGTPTVEALADAVVQALRGR